MIRTPKANAHFHMCHQTVEAVMKNAFISSVLCTQFFMLWGALLQAEDLGGWNLAEDTTKIQQAYEEQKAFQEQERQRIQEIFRHAEQDTDQEQDRPGFEAAQVTEDAELDARRRAAEAHAVYQAAAKRAASAAGAAKQQAERIQSQAAGLVRDNLAIGKTLEIAGRAIDERLLSPAQRQQLRGQQGTPDDTAKLFDRVISKDALHAMKPHLDLADAILAAHKQKLKTDIESNTSPPPSPISPEAFLATLTHDTGQYRALIEHHFDGRRTEDSQSTAVSSTQTLLVDQLFPEDGRFGTSPTAVEKLVEEQVEYRRQLEAKRLAEEQRRQEVQRQQRLAEERQQAAEQEQLARIERERLQRASVEAEQRRQAEAKRRKEQAERERWANPTRKNTSRSDDGAWEYTIHEFDRDNGWWDVIVWGRNTWPVNCHKVNFWLEIPEGAWASVSTDRWIEGYGTAGPGGYVKQQFRLHNPKAGRFNVWWQGSYWESEMRNAGVKYGDDWRVQGYRYIDP